VWRSLVTPPARRSAASFQPSGRVVQFAGFVPSSFR
jgi:hypothetical protein